MGALGDAISAYAQPLIDSTDGSLEQLKKALSISQACWNLAIMPEDLRQAAVDDLRSCFEMSDVEFDDFQRTIVWPMIRRHEQMFPRMHQRQSLEPPHWELPSPRVRLDRPFKEECSEPDRYDPCPCNSGKKYKFCCGRAHS